MTTHFAMLRRSEIDVKEAKSPPPLATKARAQGTSCQCPALVAGKKGRAGAGWRKKVRCNLACTDSQRAQHRNKRPSKRSNPHSLRCCRLHVHFKAVCCVRESWTPHVARCWDEMIGNKTHFCQAMHVSATRPPSLFVGRTYHSRALQCATRVDHDFRCPVLETISSRAHRHKGRSEAARFPKCCASGRFTASNRHGTHGKRTTSGPTQSPVSIA